MIAQSTVAVERREMALDLGVADLGQRRRPPARLVVLVDDHRAHAFVEIVAMNDARHYAEFGLHARLEIPSSRRARICASASFRLSRRFGADRGRGGLRGPFGVLAALRGRALSRMSSTRSPVNSRSIARAARHDRPLPGRLGECRQHRIDRHRAAQRFEQIGKARRRHAMGGDAGRDAVGGVEAARRSAHNKCRVSPGSRGRNQVAPTSGKKPMPTSGMAKENCRRRRDASRAPKCRRRRP